jgi:hypothetical protein
VIYYECECGQIYPDRQWAEKCCPPEITPVAEMDVVYCWRCKGDGCKACHDKPLKRKRLVQDQWKWYLRLEASQITGSIIA